MAVFVFLKCKSNFDLTTVVNKRINDFVVNNSEQRQLQRINRWKVHDFTSEILKNLAAEASSDSKSDVVEG